MVVKTTTLSNDTFFCDLPRSTISKLKELHYQVFQGQFRKTSGVLKICTKGARTGTITSYALNYQITLTLTDLGQPGAHPGQLYSLFSNSP